MQAMAQMWKQAGINVKLKVLPSAQYWEIWDKETHPFAFTTWTHRPLGVMVLGLAYRTGVPWNESKWSNKKFDEMLPRPKARLMSSKRRAIMAEIETLMQEEGPIAQPLWRAVSQPFNKNVKGLPLTRPATSSARSGGWTLRPGLKRRETTPGAWGLTSMRPVFLVLFDDKAPEEGPGQGRVTGWNAAILRHAAGLAVGHRSGGDLPRLLRERVLAGAGGAQDPGPLRDPGAAGDPHRANGPERGRFLSATSTGWRRRCRAISAIPRSTRQPVNDIIWDRLGNTGLLAAIAFAVIVPLSVLFGITAGMREGSKLDRTISVASIVTTSVPGIRLGRVPGRDLRRSGLGWLPGHLAAEAGAGWPIALQLVLPVAVMVLYDLGYVVRMVRASMVEVMTRPYIRTAVLKGLPFRGVIMKHALRNAMIAPFTVILLQINYLITGVVVVEAVFAYPGLRADAAGCRARPGRGDVIRRAPWSRSSSRVCTQIAGDLGYMLLNPRIRFS